MSDDRISAERWRRVLEVFDTALELEVDARPAFINRRCAGDAALQYEVNHLLRMNEETGSLPDRMSPAFERVT